MKNMKKYMVLSLAACITLSPLTVKANGESEIKEMVPISSPINKDEQTDQVNTPDYTQYKGKIVHINEGKGLSILVKDDERDPYNGMVFHINEDVILLSDKTKDFIEPGALKEGMTVSAYYYKNTIMALSLPPQLSPDVLVVNENEEPGIITVSGFDKDLLSTDESLRIKVDENTIIVDKNGEKIEKENIIEKDLIIFYSIVLESYPAQTSPEKIIVIEKEMIKTEADITVLDKINIDKKEISLDKHIYVNDKGVTMIPLRQIAESLGYTIKWDNETRTAELSKGAHWTSVTIGADRYSFAKMLIELGTAPELKDATTYVPFSFLEEVLRVGVNIEDTGIIEIVQ